MKKLIALDIGSSSIKACVFELGDEMKQLYGCSVDIGLYSPRPGYVENDPQEVWERVCDAFHEIFLNAKIRKEEIRLVSICSQAQCVVLVDKDGKALTPIYNSQDARAKDSFNRYFASGIVKIDGVDVFKVAKCFFATGFMPGTAKDPVFKYKWAEDHLPEIYKNTYKWLDIKDYVILRLTGEFVTTKDNAHAYTIYNSRENKGNWSKTVSQIFKIDIDKLPKIVESTDVVGVISEKVAQKTGLAVGTEIIGGIIDSTGVQYGSGAVKVGETMIYWGTSGWIGTVIDRLKINFISRMGALITAKDKRYHYYACFDSAGISYKWLKEHVIEDDGLVQLEDSKAISDETIYECMNQALKDVPAGAEGLMYAPWITGCRAPMEASDIGGMFINVKNSMDKKFFVRAVVEGVCYQYRLLLELGAKQTGVSKTIRFVGGGANSDEIAQILADVTGCVIEVPSHPRDAGAIGAAIIGFCAMNGMEIELEEKFQIKKAEKIFLPDMKKHSLYDKYYAVFLKLYKKNKKILSRLTAISEGR